MKLLRRNTTEFEYLPESDETSDLDEQGRHTGEYYPVPGTPVSYRGNISTPSGKTVPAFYGMDIRYTHVLVMDDPKAAIDEHGTIRWKGELYDIQAVRPSINALSIALRKQTVSGPQGITGETGMTGETGQTGQTGITGVTSEPENEPEPEGEGE